MICTARVTRADGTFETCCRSFGYEKDSERPAATIFPVCNPRRNPLTRLPSFFMYFDAIRGLACH